MVLRQKAGGEGALALGIGLGGAGAARTAQFALPQSWLQMFTAYLNTGDHSHGNRNGLAVTSGGTGEGQWHRSAFGSDDYTYNVGMSLAYALRPSATLRDRFAQAARTVIDRYNIPKANESQREAFVNQVSITRQTIQHNEMLANAAEFSAGSFGSQAHAKLNEIVTELSRDNLRAGLMIEGDVLAAGAYSQPQKVHASIDDVSVFLPPVVPIQ